MEKEGYLDLHSHILPRVDDGAADWDMTEQMLAEAYRQGVRRIVATPHSYPERRRHNAESIRELAQEADRKAKQIAADFSVYTGNEILFRRGIPEEIENGSVLTLADTSYVLVEFLPEERFSVIREGIQELLENGYYPVIAHAERVHTLFDKEEHLRGIAETGAYIQVNAGSLSGGRFDRRTARLMKYAEKGLVHFIGSDCHNMTTRPPVMRLCAERLTKKLGEKQAQEILFENQTRFLEGKFL